MHKKTILPPTYFYITLIIIFIFHFTIPVKTVINYPWNLIGLIPAFIGSVLNIVADNKFKTAGTTVKPFEKSSILITSGIFRISRNPMYLGMVLILLGASLICGTLSPYFIIPIFIFIIQIKFIKEEEKMLFKEFGNEWKEYKQRVRRWI